MTHDDAAAWGEGYEAGFGAASAEPGLTRGSAERLRQVIADDLGVDVAHPIVDHNFRGFIEQMLNEAAARPVAA